MKPKLLLLVLLVLASLSLVACSKKKRAVDQWPLDKAELESERAETDPAQLTYRRYCVGCHGVDGRGGGGVTGADLTAQEGPLQKSDAELIASVREGKRGKTATMPPHKPVLTEAQIAAVVAYVRKQFGPDAAAVSR